MVARFLRRFSAFCNLELEVQRQRDLLAEALRENASLANSAAKSEAQNLQLQDRLDAAYEDRQRLWSLVENSIAKMETSYQMHVNVEWQKQGRSAPYPEAPQLPEAQTHREMPNDIISRPLTMSERMAKGTQDFIKNYAGQLAAQAQAQ